MLRNLVIICSSILKVLKIFFNIFFRAYLASWRRVELKIDARNDRYYLTAEIRIANVHANIAVNGWTMFWKLALNRYSELTLTNLHNAATLLQLSQAPLLVHLEERNHHVGNAHACNRFDNIWTSWG